MRLHVVPLVSLVVLGAGCFSTPVPTPPPIPPPTSVESRDIETNAVRGVLYFPKVRTGKLPGIMVVHEWWGLNEQIKDEAAKLAEKGYAVFAIDLYGEVATDATQAARLASAVRADPDAALKRLRAGLDLLAAQTDVQSDNLAALGWCFGGGMSALVGTTGDPRLKATVIYYGSPITDAAQMSRMKQPVLGIWGEDDQSIKVGEVRDFESALKKQGTSVEFHYYAGAGHAFANPTRGDAYRPEATADAWAKTLEFLKKNLQ